MTFDYGKGPYGIKFSHRWKCVTRSEIPKMAAAKLGRSTREVGICKYQKLSKYGCVIPHFLRIDEQNSLESFI